MAPVIVGIAGGSGSGKTTFVERLIAALGEPAACVIEHDWYYRDRRSMALEARASLNFDHPDALETSLLVTHLQSLRGSRSIQVPLYNFSTHTRRHETRLIGPKATILVEGILVLADAELRDQLDVKVFVDTPDDTRFIRRLGRDTTSRGRTIASVVDQYFATVKPMHSMFVEPSRQHADAVVSGEGTDADALARVLDLIRRAM